MKKYLLILLAVLCFGFTIENSIWDYTLEFNGSTVVTTYGFRNGEIYYIESDGIAYPSKCYVGTLALYTENFAWISQSMDGTGSLLLSYFSFNFAINFMHWLIVPLLFTMELERQPLSFDENNLVIYECEG